MPQFRCHVVTQAGRRDWRTLEAPSSHAAAARLVSEGLTPLDIRSGGISLAERLHQPIILGRGASISEQALILTQLALLVRSGLPVDRSLDLLRDQANATRQKLLLSNVLDDVRGGVNLSLAIARQNLFPSYVTGVIAAAEQSGRLGEALTSVAMRMSALSTTRRQLATALAYPVAVLAATVLALILVLTVVVPQFDSTFAGQEDRLPALTLAVLSLSGFTRDYGFISFIFAVTGCLILWRLSRAAGFRELLHRYRRLVPGMRLREQYLAAQFTGILAALLGNGVPVIRSLPMAAAAIGSVRWRQHIIAVERQVREGTAFSRALAGEAFVPPTVTRLLEVGEKTGSLSETCLRANEILTDITSSRIDRIVSLANPAAIITLGGLVAMLMAGVMLGIFAIGDFAG